MSAIVPLANITLTSTASTLTFSSISGSYRDLLLVVQATSNTGNIPILCQVNGSATGYNRTEIGGNGSSALSSGESGSTSWTLGTYSYGQNTTVESKIFDFLDYSTTNKHKPILVRSNNASIGVSTIAGRWANTAAITSIVLYPSSNSFNTGSTFSLYGVTA